MAQSIKEAMMDNAGQDDDSEGKVPTAHERAPNISTGNQPEGAARRPSDTLDREPERDPQSGGAIPSNYDPLSMTRKGEEKDTRAGREGAGDRTDEQDRR